MRNSILLACLFFSTPLFAANYLLSWRQASPQVETMTGGKVLMPTQLPFTQSLKVQTRELSNLIVSENKNLVAFVHPNTTTALLINKDAGALSTLTFDLTDGKISFNLDQSSEPVYVSTDFGNFRLSQGILDITYHRQEAKLEIRNLEGHRTFKINDAEDGIELAEGQSVIFHGERNEEGLIYNYLLGGKKVAQGKWSMAKPLAASDKKEMYAVWKDLKVVRQKIEKVIKQQTARKTLCGKPSGNLNQCAWVCENNPKGEKHRCRLELAKVQCKRQRCFADGEWKENLILDKGEGQLRCKATTVVGDCFSAQ